MKILVGADIVPTKSNIEYFNNGNISDLIGTELVDILNNCDFRILNLEVPLVDKSNPIKKVAQI